MSTQLDSFGRILLENIRSTMKSTSSFSLESGDSVVQDAIEPAISKYSQEMEQGENLLPWLKGWILSGALDDLCSGHITFQQVQKQSFHFYNLLFERLAIKVGLSEAEMKKLRPKQRGAKLLHC
jgi:hypothetical protein